MFVQMVTNRRDIKIARLGRSKDQLEPMVTSLSERRQPDYNPANSRTTLLGNITLGTSGCVSPSLLLCASIAKQFYAEGTVL